MTRSASALWPTGQRTVFFDDAASRSTLGRAVAAGRIRRLAPRLYSADLASDPADIVAANRWPILGRLLPGAIVVDRSAAHNGSPSDGCLFVAAERERKPLQLPGLEVHVRAGAPFAEPTPDLPWPNGLAMSSPARIVVDNLAVSRGRSGRTPRTLSLAELEDWLAAKSITWGTERISRLHENAIALAEAVGVPERVELIDRLFDQLAGRRPLRPSGGQLLLALRHDRAWDVRRVEMFNRLAQSITTYEDPDVPDWLPAGLEAEPNGEAVARAARERSEQEREAIGDATSGRANLRTYSDTAELPFFESYFSNYIEGTVFTVPEARRIVDTQQPPPARPADGHDILGTYRCVADTVGRRTTSDDVDEFLNLLRERHRMILGGRPEMTPGEWKQRNNQVGAFVFVEPQLVEGTLRQGFELAGTVPAGFRRALFMMFLVAEVHPFTDGNGRVARVMMNAELSAVDAARIIIPAVYRNEYIGCLRRTSTTQADDVAALMRVMSFAWRWTAAMPWHDRGAADGQLEATNALRDPDEAAFGAIKLRLP